MILHSMMSKSVSQFGVGRYEVEHAQQVAKSWEPGDPWGYHHGTRQPVSTEVQQGFVTEVVR